MRPTPRLTRQAFVALAATTALTAPTASAAGAPRLAGTFAGTTVLTASRPVAGDVVVPRDARVDTPFGATPDVTATGTGRVATFVLNGADRRTAGRTFVGGAGPDGVAFFMPLVTFPVPEATGFENVKTFDDVTTIPAGRYRLYVIPDGATARIVLRLDGLRGATTIAPTAPAVAAVTSDADAAAVPPSSVATYLPHRMRGDGLVLQVLSVRMDLTAAWQLVMCHDTPGSDGDPPVWSSPGCPDGDEHIVNNQRFPDVNPDVKQFVQVFGGLPAGDHAVSTVFSAEGLARDLRHAAVWLTF